MGIQQSGRGTTATEFIYANICRIRESEVIVFLFIYRSTDNEYRNILLSDDIFLCLLVATIGSSMSLVNLIEEMNR